MDDENKVEKNKSVKKTDNKELSVVEQYKEDLKSFIRNAPPENAMGTTEKAILAERKKFLEILNQIK